MGFLALLGQVSKIMAVDTKMSIDCDLEHLPQEDKKTHFAYYWQDLRVGKFEKLPFFTGELRI